MGGGLLNGGDSRYMFGGKSGFGEWALGMRTPQHMQAQAYKEKQLYDMAEAARLRKLQEEFFSSMLPGGDPNATPQQSAPPSAAGGGGGFLSTQQAPPINQQQMSYEGIKAQMPGADPRMFNANSNDTNIMGDTAGRYAQPQQQLPTQASPQGQMGAITATQAAGGRGGAASMWDMLDRSRQQQILMGVQSGLIPDSVLGEAMAPQARLQDEENPYGEAIPGAGQRHPVTNAISGYQGVPTPPAPIRIGDQSSPTGSRFVPQQDAIGQPGVAPSSMDLEVGPSGGVRFRTGSPGGGSSGGGLTTTNETVVQREILDIGDNIANLYRLKSNFKPEYQTLGARGKNWWNQIRARAGADLTDDDRRGVEEFATYRANATRLISIVMNQLSGAAVNEHEQERMEGFIPVAGTGVFDGDDPVTFKAKLDDFIAMGEMAWAKYSYIQKHGLSVDDVNIEDMTRIMSERASEIEAEMRRGGMNDEATLRRVIPGKVMQEFGVGMQ